jgi:cytochrome P450
MLGVDPGDMPQFKRWSDARLHSVNPGRTPQQSEAWAVARRELNDYLARVVEVRRRCRGADVISMLVAAEEAGDRLSAREIVITCDLLLVAGNLPSRPGESHPEPLTGPDVNLSIYPARATH